jgi:F0F1-type ATP synthase alpha subunit
MPDISQMTKSSYLKRSDLGKGKLLTINRCVAEELEGDNGTEKKWVLHFDEEEKGMVLNVTNAQIIAQFTNERNSDNWRGVKVVAYDDPNVSMGGKLVGGIRVRAPKPGSVPAPAPAPTAPEATDIGPDEIPF